MKTLEKLPQKNTEVNQFVNDVIGEILEGNVNPLEMEIRLRIIEKAVTAIRKDIRVKNVVMEEADKYHNQDFKGALIKVGTRKTADYSADSQWCMLRAQLKARETLLKECNGSDPDTGEVVVQYKESETLTIKL
jgi:hypothetical protein|tara:strand:- start:1 stop:402 length:402 start_codon:yes stop_codon:yes gene_type:complete